MCNLTDEKYKVALLIRASSQFSIPEIIEGLDLERDSDAIYAVIGELLEKDIIAITDRVVLMPDQGIFRLYENILTKRDQLDKYIAELNHQRFQPDAQGKPRGLNFRLAESLLNQVQRNTGTLGLEERNKLFNSIDQYIALAQADEVHQDARSARSPIVEAHLRKLYAEYLSAKGLWPNAIMQYLIANRLFIENNLVTEAHIVEILACKLVTNRYSQIRQDKSYNFISMLLDFAQVVDKIIDSSIRAKCDPFLFVLTSRYILNEISQLIERLDRHTGDFITVIKRGWTISNTFKNEIIRSIFTSLNEARLCAMNRQGSEALVSLKQAISIFQDNRGRIGSTEVANIEKVLQEHFVNFKLYDLLDRVDHESRQDDTGALLEQVMLFGQMDMEDALPFYVVDVVEKSKSILNSLVLRLEEKPFRSRSIQSADDTSMFVYDETIKRRLDETRPSSELAFQEWSNWGQSTPLFVHGQDQFNNPFTGGGFTKTETTISRNYGLHAESTSTRVDREIIDDDIDTTSLRPITPVQEKDNPPIDMSLLTRRGESNRKLILPSSRVQVELRLIA